VKIAPAALQPVVRVADPSRAVGIAGSLLAARGTWDFFPADSIGDDVELYRDARGEHLPDAPKLTSCARESAVPEPFDGLPGCDGGRVYVSQRVRSMPQARVRLPGRPGQARDTRVPWLSPFGPVPDQSQRFQKSTMRR
jgi:hypothetical protein